MAIPIAGPKADAVIYLVATQRADKWEYEHLIVKVGEFGAHIDLR